MTTGKQVLIAVIANVASVAIATSILIMFPDTSPWPWLIIGCCAFLSILWISRSELRDWLKGINLPRFPKSAQAKQNEYPTLSRGSSFKSTAVVLFFYLPIVFPLGMFLMFSLMAGTFYVISLIVSLFAPELGEQMRATWFG